MAVEVGKHARFGDLKKLFKGGRIFLAGLAVTGGTAFAVDKLILNRSSEEPRSKAHGQASDEFIEHLNGANLLELKLELKDHLEIQAGINAFPATPDIIISITENSATPYSLPDRGLPVAQLIFPVKLSRGERMTTNIVYYDNMHSPLSGKPESLPLARLASFEKDPEFSIPIIPGMKQVELFKVAARRQGDTFDDMTYKITTNDAVYRLRVNGVNSRNAQIRPDIDAQIPFLRQGETREEFPFPDQKGLNISIGDFRTIFTTSNKNLGFVYWAYNKDFPSGVPLRSESLTNNNNPLYLQK